MIPARRLRDLRIIHRTVGFERLPITEALHNDVPHSNSVRQVLERRREQRHQPPPLTLTLPDNDRARNIIVRSPSLAHYDAINPDPDTEPDDDHTP